MCVFAGPVSACDDHAKFLPRPGREGLRGGEETCSSSMLFYGGWGRNWEEGSS